jgi:hypothetical protein
MKIPATILGCVAAIGLGGGCGSTSPSTDATDAAAARPAPRAAPKREPAPAPDPLVLSHCPAGHPACRTTRGRIVYGEHTDPDGDGDAHFVIVDPQGISLPGITAVDVRRGLRPDPLPGIGELISAAGPVQTGSYGQSQIHALELHVAGE